MPTRRSTRGPQPALDLLVVLRSDAGRPLHQQVYDGVRAGILAGRLAGGVRLPSTRALATTLGISRVTVASAFDQLRAEGYVEGRHGSGTYVCGRPPDDALRVRSSARMRVTTPRARTNTVTSAVTARAAVPNAPDAPRQPTLPMTTIADLGELSCGPGGAEAFRIGVPALDVYPVEHWARLISRQWRRAANPRTAATLLGYGDPRGYAPLRHAIADYLNTSRGAQCHADQVIITNGAQQALDLVCRTLVEPGQRAWIEEPGYPGVRQTLCAAGADIAAVPLDAEGLDVKAGVRMAPHKPSPRLVYVSPSHQYPTGVTMSAPRRMELLRWAAEAGVWIIEDDYDSEFRYSARPLACLQGLDVESHGADGRVLYVGTFSKALCPALRIGYLVAPPALVERLVVAKSMADSGTPVVEQAALAEYIDGGWFARHLRRTRTLYAARQRMLVDAVRAHLGEWLEASPAPAGMHLVVPLRASLTRHGITDRDVYLAARERGVVAAALSSRRAVPRPEAAGGALLLGYAAYDESVIDAGVRRLGEAIAGLVRRSRQAAG